jgi:deazaflavin-dependent oxidoreductase (nitroreductase family)
MKWQLKLERPLIVLGYRVFSRWVGDQLKFLLLTTTGRKSQRRRTVPLVYMPAEDGFVVTAANVGLDQQPGWFLNLKHNPQALIQIGTETMPVFAHEVVAEDRERLWARWIRANPGYVSFQAKTARKLPMVILKPTRSE